MQNSKCLFIGVVAAVASELVEDFWRNVVNQSEVTLQDVCQNTHALVFRQASPICCESKDEMNCQTIVGESSKTYMDYIP